MSVEYTLKKHMDEIIENAFYKKDKEQIRNYEKFKIIISDKCPKTFTGKYQYKGHIVTLYRIDENPTQTIMTLIHEVAHHIEYCDTGKTGHQKFFYHIYRSLIYSALDLEKISLYEVRKAYKKNRDSQKVNKILDLYNRRVPNIDYVRNDQFTIKVSNGYDCREKLKQNGYFWNAVSKTWDKENITKEYLDIEMAYLKDAGVLQKDIYVSDASMINMESFVYKNKQSYIGQLIVTGNTYELKKSLKINGFYWEEKDKVWKKLIQNEDVLYDSVDKILSQYPKLTLTYTEKTD